MSDAGGMMTPTGSTTAGATPDADTAKLPSTTKGEEAGGWTENIGSSTSRSMQVGNTADCSTKSTAVATGSVLGPDER